MLDSQGRYVNHYLEFAEVNSPFGFLRLLRVEKEGYAVHLSQFELQKIVYYISGLKFQQC